MGNRKVVDWTVLCEDGSEVYIYATTAVAAYMEAIERGYKPASINDIKETEA